MRVRSRVDERVVLPVPESPKNSATSLSGPTLAEQCMGSTPRAGSSKFIIEKAAFFISPAYSVEPTITSFSLRFMAMTVSLRVPMVAGSARRLGRSRMV